MDRIYCEFVYSPATDETRAFLQSVYELIEMAQERFDEDHYKKLVRYLYENVRAKLNCINKVLSLVKDVITDEVYIVLFPKEVDVDDYVVHFDEESKLFYI